MFFQSIIVYSTLIVIMILFASHAARLGNKYELKGDKLVVKRSFLKFEIIVPIILFAIVMGMRYNVGADHLTYLENYLSNRHSGKGEFLFNIFSDVGWYFNFHYTVFFGLIAFVQLFFFFLAFRDERFLFPLLVFFLFTNGNFLFFLNVIRQGLALCIWLYAIRFIEFKKPYKYLLFSLAIFFVHRSSIILIVFYPLLKDGKDYFKSINLQVILFFGAFVVKQVLFSVLINLESLISFYSSLLGEGLYDNYGLETLKDSVSENQGSGLSTYFKIGLNFIIILYSKRLKEYYNSKRFIIIYFFFLIGVLTTYIFPDGVISLSRPFRYFYIFQPIMYSYFLYYLYKKRAVSGNYMFLIGLIFVFIVVFVLAQFAATEESFSLFQFYFQNPLNYEYPY